MKAKRPSLKTVAKKVANMTKKTRASYINYLYNLVVTDIEREIEAYAL